MAINDDLWDLAGSRSDPDAVERALDIAHENLATALEDRHPELTRKAIREMKSVVRAAEKLSYLRE